MTPSRLRRWALRSVFGLLLLVLLVAMAVWGFLRASLPQLDGEVPVHGLAGTVQVERDGQGVPTVRGENRLDVAYATGYLHGQDRFFQMDLLRRVAAGELAGLVGAAALETDRDHRFHRFRARAEAALKTLPAAELQLLERYTAGANAGLAALGARPFEYGLLRTQPEPWQPADSLLVVWAMYFELQGKQERREFGRGWLRSHSTPEQLAVLLPEATEFDTPIDAPAIAPSLGPFPATAPGWLGQRAPAGLTALEASSSVGSNNWALAASRSKDGRVLIADDMHLGIRLPHIWYRAVLQYPDGQGGVRRVAGVTLPGAPLVVVGSNGRVAWGFTNSYGDYLDLVELARDPAQPLRFKTAAGWETVRQHREILRVKGGEPQAMTVLESSLGPLREIGGRYYAVHWVAHQPGAVNLRLAEMEGAANLAAALAVANSAGMPAQNMLAGDASGHIGWTIAGPLPGRDASLAASFPYDSTQPLGWQTPRAPADYPRLLDPVDGQLWTANNRQLAGPEYRKLGDGGADIGARARQIRDGLTALQKADEKAVHDIGLDDRALFIDAWRKRALQVLDPAALAGQPARSEFRRLLEQSWDGHASVKSVGYRLARNYMHGLYTELFGGLDKQLELEAKGSTYVMANPRWPAVVARLLDEQPPGWLPPGRSDWRAVQLAAIDRVIADLTSSGSTLEASSWGLRNLTSIEHPFARRLGILGSWLSASGEAQAGDEHMPRVAGPSFGQSERMVVSPGHEEQGILTLPGGPSGHPLSPYFLAGHAAWLKGEPAPFLPGPAVHTLKFVPEIWGE
ncbi:penicillin acylase family protein [Chitinimonas arctica]|uniref:Penicillin acylase family protein n=1 Tax=Chitinimonas arctica TaxID=2594795 RepID=A0A516SC25_9NEIS|nr:penicillin acylase family protein [Chitinimonas arctica]QDQ25697.1 penicillin acylase family protein [Chitinimonas arctica]